MRQAQQLALVFVGALVLGGCHGSSNGAHATAATTATTTSTLPPTLFVPNASACDIRNGGNLSLDEMEACLQWSNTTTTTTAPIDWQALAALNAGVPTLDKYNQIQDGMSYTQVQQIMGSPGDQTVHDSVAGITGDIYEWQDSSSGITVQFQDGRVVGKSQFGL